MRITKKTRYGLESLIIPLVLVGINLFVKGMPGFGDIYFTPYLIGALFFAVYAGLEFGFISYFFSLLLVFFLFPPLFGIFHTPLDGSVYRRALMTVSVYAAPPSLLLLYLFGMINRRFVRESVRIRGRYKALVKRNYRLSVQSDALFEVFRELEERLSRQEESIMSLYNQVKKVDTVTIQTVLDVLLETVQLFTKAESASVWKYAAASGSMQLAARIGWDADEKIDAEIDVDQSIEGWVVRNNQLFTIRNLLQYENLKRLDTGRNLITFPIQTGNRIWGVLNIEEMPFIKYNHYTERLLFIIISLIEPSLQKAVEYESLVHKEEFDTVTGLPLFTSFYKVLNEEVKRKSLEQGKLSIIITEIVNFPTLVSQYGREAVQKIIPSVVEQINRASGFTGQAFEYKEDSQVAFLFPNLDYDGASLYCLEILGIMNGADWKIDNRPVMLEAVIGYSSYSGNESPDELLDIAENLVEMQKI